MRIDALKVKPNIPSVDAGDSNNQAKPVTLAPVGFPPIEDVKVEAKQLAKDAADKALRQVVSDIGQVAINQYGRLVIKTKVGQRYGALIAGSSQFNDIVQAKASSLGKTIGRDKLNSEKERLRGEALLAGNTVTTYVRVANHDCKYQLDLGDGQKVVVQPGSWSVEENCDVPFYMVGGSLPTPTKPSNVSAGYAYICDFLRRAGVPEHMHLVCVVVLIEYFRPDTAHPILDIVGPSGGGKTTLALMLINLIDPATDWKVGETRLEEEHVAAAAHIRYMLLVDNTGSLSQDIQNLACRVCYGTVLMAREYYAQDTVFQVKVHSPIVIASINPAITNPDLLARAVRIPFKQRSGGYISELEIRSRYAVDRPIVLGALLELFSQGLAMLPKVVGQRQWKHRLVDLAQMGEAVAQILGMEPGTFVTSLNSMREDVATDIVEGDKFVSTVIEFLTEASERATVSESIPSFKSWARKTGWAAIKKNNIFKVAVKPGALLEYVKNAATLSSLNYTQVEKWCPDNARAMTSILNIKLPLLADLGIKAENRPDYGGKKNGAWVFAFKELTRA